MTEDQFMHLLEQNNARLMERIDTRLEEKNAALFGQLSQYFDKRFETLDNKLDDGLNRIYNSLDGITERLDSDEQERAAITSELLSRSWLNYNSSTISFSHIITGTMLIHKCDRCGAEIGGPALDRESIQVSVGGGWGVELCAPCARPVIRFLERSQLLEEQLARHGYIKRPTTGAKPKPTSPPPASSATPAKTSLNPHVW